MRRSVKRRFYLGFLLLFLSIAPIIAQETATETPVPPTEIPPSPTLEPSLTPLSTETPLPSETATALPSVTPLPTETPTETATLALSETPSETATLSEPEVGGTEALGNENLLEASSTTNDWTISLSDGAVSCHNNEICAYVSIQTGTGYGTHIQSIPKSTRQTIHATVEFDHYLSGITYTIALEEPQGGSDVDNGYQRWYADESLAGERIWSWPSSAWNGGVYADLQQVQIANRYEIFLTKASISSVFSWTDLTISSYTLGAAVGTPSPFPSQTAVPTANATTPPAPLTPPPPVLGGACGISTSQELVLYNLPALDSETLVLSAGSAFNIVELQDFISETSRESWYKVNLSLGGEELTKYLPSGLTLSLAEAECLRNNLATVSYDSSASGSGGGIGGGSGSGWGDGSGALRYQSSPPLLPSHFAPNCLVLLDDIILYAEPAYAAQIIFRAPPAAYPQIGAKLTIGGTTWYYVNYFQKYLEATENQPAEWRFYLYPGWFEGTAYNIEGTEDGCQAIPDASSLPGGVPGSHLSLPVISAPLPQMVFSNRYGGDSEIFLSSGLSASAITNNSTVDINPSFSPDGAQIAFQSFRVGLWGIYSMNADGSNERAIVLNNALEPDWYPDGTALVYARGAGLYRIHADGNPASETQLANHLNGSVHSPSVSQDGNWIVYQANGSLYILSGTCMSSCTPSLLISGGIYTHPAWSPDAQSLAFGLNSDIYTATVNYGSGIPTLSNVTALTEANSRHKDSNPTWTSDGNSIVFESDREGSPSLYQVDLGTASASMGMQAMSVQTEFLSAGFGGRVIEQAGEPDGVVAQAQNPTPTPTAPPLALMQLTVDTNDSTENNNSCSLAEAIKKINGISVSDCPPAPSTLTNAHQILFAEGMTNIVLCSQQNSCSSDYRGGYGDNALPIIQASVLIDGGSNRVTIERDSTTTAPFRLMEIGNGVEVTIRNITFKNGLASRTGGGAIFSQQGIIRIENSSFEGNSSNVALNASGQPYSTLGGAIYIYQGRLTISNSTFTTNSMLTDLPIPSDVEISGGAIATLDSSVDISFTSFSNNSASTSGNAIYIKNPLDASSVVSNSCFLNNGALASGQNDNNRVDFLVNSPFVVNASHNYWGNPPDTIWSTDVVATTSPALEECLLTGQEEYRIAFVGVGGANWTVAQEASIRAGVAQTGLALQLLMQELGIPVATPQEAFNRVIVDSAADFDGYVLFVRVNTPTETTVVDPNNPNNTFSIAEIGNYCFAQAGNPSAHVPQIIACNGFSDEFGEQTTVHEVGHLFDYRTAVFDPVREQFNGGLSLLMGLSSAVALLDCNNRVVFGEDGRQGVTWTRGEDGWGSGPSSDGNLFTIFQQHPAFYEENTGKDNEEIQEAAADMFLNWVYRYSTDTDRQSHTRNFGGCEDVNPSVTGVQLARQPEDWVSSTDNPNTATYENTIGFLNHNWAGVESSVATHGTLDASLSGDLRYIRVHRYIRELVSGLMQ